MPKFIVYYADDISAHYGRRPDAFVDLAKYREVVSIAADDLEDVFRRMNVVDGDEIPVTLHVRSMCAGDVVIDEAGKTWYCDSAGWREIPTS